MASNGASLTADTLLEAPVTAEHIRVVIDDRVVLHSLDANTAAKPYGLVEHSSRVCLSYGDTNCVGNALTERASAHLDAWEMALGVARGPAFP